VAGGAGGARSSLAMRCAKGIAVGSTAGAVTPLRHVDGGMQPAQTCSAAAPSCLPIGMGIDIA